MAPQLAVEMPGGSFQARILLSAVGRSAQRPKEAAVATLRERTSFEELEKILRDAVHRAAPSLLS